MWGGGGGSVSMCIVEGGRGRMMCAYSCVFVCVVVMVVGPRCC